MDVCCECCVLSGRGLCDELITRPEKSYRLWCVVVCDLETSWMRRPWPALGRSATQRNNKYIAWECVGIGRWETYLGLTGRTWKGVWKYFMKWNFMISVPRQILVWWLNQVEWDIWGMWCLWITNSCFRKHWKQRNGEQCNVSNTECNTLVTSLNISTSR